MKKKKLLLFVVGVILPLFCIGCADTKPDEKTPWSWEASFQSENIGITGSVLSDKPIMTNKLKRSFGDWHIGIMDFTNLGGESYGKTHGDEFRVFAGWDHSYDWFCLKLDTHYAFVKELSMTRDDIWVINGEINFPKVPLIEPYVIVRRFNELSSRGPDGGWFVLPGVRRSQPLGFRLGKEEVVVKLDVSAAYSDGARGKSPGFVFLRGTLGFPIVLCEHLTLTPNVLYQVPIGGQENNPHPYVTKPQLVGGISVKFDF